MAVYVIARTAKGRPTLQHEMLPGYWQTLCGLEVTRWSRAYQSESIPAILCKKCNRKGA